LQRQTSKEHNNMKRIFILAIAILSMVIVMASCNNSEDGFIAQRFSALRTQAKQEMELNLMVAVTPEQQLYFDEVYTVEMAGKLKTVRVAEMTAITYDQARSFGNGESMARYFDGRALLYIYPLGKLAAGETGKVQNHQVLVKAQHPTEELNYIEGVCFVSASSQLNSTNVEHLWHGIKGDDQTLADWAQFVNESHISTQMKY